MPSLAQSAEAKVIKQYVAVNTKNQFAEMNQYQPHAK